MAWEHGKYYTRSKRSGGRIVREYIGCGRLAELCAQTDKLVREQRHRDAAVRRREREALEALEADVKALCALADLLARAALLVAGYHSHKRQWRKRRGQSPRKM